MPVLLKGFPQEVSEYVELPNIAELLISPVFYCNPIEDVYKRGTEFQKSLMDKVSLKNTKKYISVCSEVRFLDKVSRSVTMSDEAGGWHIDSFVDLNKYYEETDVVHLLTNDASSMTEFNKNNVIIDIDEKTTSFNGFIKHVMDNKDKLGLEGQLMPANKFVTFTNHMHKATPSTKIEFRYMLRIVESDSYSSLCFNVPNEVGIYNSKNDWVTNIKYDRDRIFIYFPETLKGR